MPKTRDLSPAEMRENQANLRESARRLHGPQPEGRLKNPSHYSEVYDYRERQLRELSRKGLVGKKRK